MRARESFLSGLLLGSALILAAAITTMPQVWTEHIYRCDYGPLKPAFSFVPSQKEQTVVVGMQVRTKDLPWTAMQYRIDEPFQLQKGKSYFVTIPNPYSIDAIDIYERIGSATASYKNGKPVTSCRVEQDEELNWITHCATGETETQIADTTSTTLPK